MIAESNLQNKYFEELISNKTPVSVFLKNGIKLSGFFVATDCSVVFLKNLDTQMIFKSAISTVVPQ
jgi:host factor-I protein